MDLGATGISCQALRKLLRSTQVQQTSLSFLLPKLSNNLSYCIPKLCRMEAWIFLPLTILALFESGRTWESKLCLSYIACSKTLHKAIILRARATACYTVSCIFYTKKKKTHDANCSSSSYASLQLKTVWLVTALAGSVVQIVWDDEMHTCNSSQSTFTHIVREVHLLC